MNNLSTKQINIGIIHSDIIKFTLNSTYSLQGKNLKGKYEAKIQNGAIKINGKSYKTALLLPENENDSFTINEVMIGVNFHWQRLEKQTFQGSLKLIVRDNKITAINILSIEAYLKSVISSEMSPTAQLEFLKAHAVISRSWLLSQIIKRKQGKTSHNTTTAIAKDNQLIKWYDRDDHTDFDVCADDHCQRYQGITKIHHPNAIKAVNETRSEVLTYNDEICDARFSKCCGGMMEEYHTCWEDEDKPYLQAKPDPYCNTNDKKILSEVLNDFDRETADFYHWTRSYTQEELSTLIKEKSGLDFENIIDLIPIRRGKSGRISLLKIIGTKLTYTIGKELEIRRWLNPTHLYSSAFDVIKTDVDKNNIPQTFTLKGKGWGHGVGLCQIGAAVMGNKGFTYKEILGHYYPGSKVETIKDK